VDAAVDEVDTTVGFDGDFFAVGDENDGGFFFSGELGDEIDDHGAGGGVEIAGGFVGEKDRGLVDEGTGEGSSLELSTGELVGAMVGAVGELNGFKEIVGTVTSRGVDTSREEEGEENVFFDRKSGEKVKELKNEADFQATESGQFIVVKGVEGMSFEVSLA
jgi:hypothetical protein